MDFSVTGPKTTDTDHRIANQFWSHYLTKIEEKMGDSFEDLKGFIPMLESTYKSGFINGINVGVLKNNPEYETRGYVLKGDALVPEEGV